MAMASEHPSYPTPGPWVVVPADDLTAVDIRETDAPHYIATVWGSADREPAMRANAGLIALAPNLLLALKAIVEDALSDRDLDPVALVDADLIADARLLIAHAEGVIAHAR